MWPHALTTPDTVVHCVWCLCVWCLCVQLGVAAYLYAGLHQTTYAAVLLGLILPQVRGVGI